MVGWLRYLGCAAVGLIVGTGAAVQTVRSGTLQAMRAIGPWRTSADLADASARTRAVVALHGLLALPAREARYYTADADDAGRPLDARCSYRITGTALPARWWSLTLYGADGYLVANPAHVYSITDAALAPAERTAWTVRAASAGQGGHWLPTGGTGRFELTLRTYLPVDGGRSDSPPAVLPRIDRERCA